jgi:SAM-dependent methyltransferase
MSAISALQHRVNDATPFVLLDLACGDARFATAWANERPQDSVHGLDRDIPTLTGTKRTALSVVGGDMLALPYQDDSFDLIHCSLGLYYVPLRPGLAEIKRVLRRNGEAYVTVPLLSWARVRHEIGRSRGNPKLVFYSLSHIVNGIVLALFRRQFRNPFLRHDSWGLFGVRNSLLREIKAGGFNLRRTEVAAASGRSVTTLRVWLERS